MHLVNLRCPKWLYNRMVTRALKHPLSFIWGKDNTLYMERYSLGKVSLNWLRWFGVRFSAKDAYIEFRIHYFVRGDKDLELHDHPWWNVSWLLQGHYTEILQTHPHDHTGYRVEARSQGDIILRSASTLHRISDPLPSDRAISLFITGPYQRRWGFLKRDGTWLYWRKFLGIE